MSKKSPSNESSDNTLPIDTPESSNQSLEDSTNTSNNTSYKSNSVLEPNIQSKSFKLKSINELKDGFRISRIDDSSSMKSNSKQNKESKLMKFNAKQRLLKELKISHLKRNQLRNQRSMKSSNSPHRNSLGELVDMIIQFNINPPLNRPKPVYNLNEQIIREQTGRPIYSTSLPQSPNVSNLSNSNFSNLSTRSTSLSSNLNNDLINTLNPVLTSRIDPTELRILMILEQLTSLLDRFVLILGEFREEVELHEIRNRQLERTRMSSNENNSLLIEAITTTLPERLAELFGVELERALAKFLGQDKKKG